MFYTSDPFPSYNLQLTVEALYDIPIKAVRNLNKQNEFEHIMEGGLNDYVHMRRKPISQPFTFEIDRYVTNALTDPLSLGTELSIPVILWVNKWQTDSESESAKIFIFTSVKVMGKRYSEFDSSRSALAMETITLCYNNMYVLSNLTDLG